MTKRTKFSGEFSGQKGKQEIIEVKDAAAVLKLLEADDEPLIPGLPDHVSHLCLCKIHPSLLYSVCSSWRRLIYSPLFPPFPSLYTLLAPTSATQHEKSSNQLITSPITFMNFDPISCQWSSIPSPPDPPLRLLWRHPSFISRNLPVQSLSVRNNLILLAATTHHLLPALPRPLIFNPLTQAWSHGPALKAPRRWCAAGGVRGKLYVASGIGSHFSTDVARSVERWDVGGRPDRGHRSGCGKWEKLGTLRNIGKFCREAVEAVGWKGKLCMVNVKGYASKEGALVYDVERDKYMEMPEGMIAGWKGPAAAMDEQVIYAVDESKGVLRRYDEGSDSWVDILESPLLRGAQQVAAAAGRVCVVCDGGGDGGSKGIVVVDVVAEKPRLWVVETPPEFQAVAVHILPRMSRSTVRNGKNV